MGTHLYFECGPGVGVVNSIVLVFQGADEAQRAFFDFHHHHHGTKVQAVVGTDGMVNHLSYVEASSHNDNFVK